MSKAKILKTHYDGGEPKYLAGETYPVDGVIAVMMARGFAEAVADEPEENTAPQAEPVAAPVADVQPEPEAEPPADAEASDDPSQSITRRGRRRMAGVQLGV